MNNATCWMARMFRIVVCAASAGASLGNAQTRAESCIQPLCVNRTDDAPTPAPGMLRHALLMASNGAVITFDPALNGQTIKLDTRLPNNHIKIGVNVAIQGPGASLLTISGENRTRIFFVSGGSVLISGVTLANGLARGGDGDSGTDAGGGGGGAAGLGGAIFQSGGYLTLSNVALSRNRAVGGNGGYGGSNLNIGNGGAGGSLATDDLTRPPSASTAGHLGGGPEIDGVGGAGGGSETASIAGANGGFGAGGGGGGCSFLEHSRVGGHGGMGGFGGGAGGTGGSFDAEGDVVPPTGGGGGAGLGGAIFVRSGRLRLIDTVFMDNSSTGGLSANGAESGPAKGGALFLCSADVCGVGYDALAVSEGSSSFRGSTAEIGPGQSCPGWDNTDVCGRLASASVTRFAVAAPLAVEPGAPFSVAVTALDENSIPVFTYSGRVHLASSDPSSILPAEASFSEGSASFPVTLKTAGSHTITLTDSASPAIQGTSRAIAVTFD